MSNKAREESILCAAILIEDGKERIRNPVNVSKGFVATGYRHPNCFQIIAEVFGFVQGGGYPKKFYKYKQTQGFLTSKNRFVDRKEAAIIARNAAQINAEQWRDGMELCSEDLY